jgi:tetratricopeptide (TPR) repeat protein
MTPAEGPIRHSRIPEAAVPDGRVLHERYAATAAELSALQSVASSSADRDALKQTIISLFRDVDAAASHFLTLKESVKTLVAEWKLLGGGGPSAGGPSAAASTTAAAPVDIVRPTISARVDHLGASTFVEKGWSKLSLGDPAGAEVALRRALELAPEDNDAEALLGWAQMMQRQFDDALVTLRGVLARDPDHALAQANIGYISLRQQLFGDAIEQLSRAIRLEKDRKATLYAHLYMGMVYHEREMYDDAELFFKRTLELGPNLLQAWYELGRTLWFANRPEAAIGAWREGAEANKFNPWGKRCSEMMLFVLQGGTPPRSD